MLEHFLCAHERFSTVCVHFYCIPALCACISIMFKHFSACISIMFQHFLCAHSYCIPALLACISTMLKHFSACISTMLQHFFACAFLLYSSTACVHFYYAQNTFLRAFLLCSSTFLRTFLPCPSTFSMRVPIAPQHPLYAVYRSSTPAAYAGVYVPQQYSLPPGGGAPPVRKLSFLIILIRRLAPPGTGWPAGRVG